MDIIISCENHHICLQTNHICIFSPFDLIPGGLDEEDWGYTSHDQGPITPSVICRRTKLKCSILHSNKEAKVDVFVYLADAVLGSKGQNETVTLATCFSEAPLMAAMLIKQARDSKSLMTSYSNRFFRFYEFEWVTFGAIFWEDCESQWLTVKMPRNGRRKRSLSSGEDSLVSYYSKHRCIDREYSPVADNRHYKRGSSSIRSRERRHNRHLSRNRSRSTRRSDRRLRRQKYRNDPSEVSTVRSNVPDLFLML